LVSSQWLSLRHVQRVSLATDGKLLVSGTLPFACTIVARWPLKCIPPRRDCTNKLT
jgi:hypothetical protein